MQHINIPILCTRSLSPGLIALAEENGIHIDIVPFIRTEPLESKQLSDRIQYLSSESITAVFTSMNAAESVISNLNGVKPLWRIYCLGNTTRKILVQYFGKQSIVAFAENASALANTIVNTEAMQEAVFFCGDQRRDELPAILGSHGVTLEEVIVYRTIALTNTLNGQYQGILFFSPSAVSAFFSSNKISPQTDLFAIGQTTAEEIKRFTNNTVVVADKAGKEELVNKTIAYYKSLKKESIPGRN
jgi:uroporphyrinogen-III synthase